MTFKYKLFISYVFLQTLLSVGYAQEKKIAPKDSSYFKTGFYGGALVGYATDKLFNSNYYDGTPDAGTTEKQISANPTSNTFTGDLVFGGRILLNNGFMPGFDVTLSSVRSKWEMDFPYAEFINSSGNPLHVRVEKLYSVTPALVLGGIVKDRFYIFTKLGLSVNRMKTTIYAQEYKGGRKDQSEFLFGLSASVGLEYSLNSNWSIMGTLGYETTRASEYVSRNYQPTIGGYHDDIVYNKIKTVSYTQKVGIIYKF